MRRQEAENRVGAARDRNRDRQHVVDHQRASRDQPGIRPEQLGRDQIAAAAGRELRSIVCEYEAEMMKTVSAVSIARKTARY